MKKNNIDFEQKYYDLLYEAKKDKKKIKELEEDIILLKNNKSNNIDEYLQKKLIRYFSKDKNEK